MAKDEKEAKPKSCRISRMHYEFEITPQRWDGDLAMMAVVPTLVLYTVLAEKWPTHDQAGKPTMYGLQALDMRRKYLRVKFGAPSEEAARALGAKINTALDNLAAEPAKAFAWVTRLLTRAAAPAGQGPT